MSTWPVALSRRSVPSGDDLLDAIRRARARALQRALQQRDEAALPLTRLQAGLGPGDLLLDFLVGRRRGLLFAVRRDDFRAIPIDGLERLAPAVTEFRQSLIDGRGSDASARELGAALIEPIGNWLNDAERVLVVPDRELALVPFSALPVDGSAAAPRLGDAHTVALLPLTDAPQQPSTVRTPILLAGQPSFDTDDGYAPLPWSGLELARLQETWSDQAELLTGDRFLPDALEALELERFRTLHFSTHAIASTRDPRKCGVVCSRGQRLGLDRVSRLPLDRALVVLSACRTGQGELLPGEGVVGLGWAFLQAGAEAIVVSHWSVDDASAARLMIEFHQALRDGRTPTDALAAAKRSRRAAGDPAKDWAPFEILLRPQPTER